MESSLRKRTAETDPMRQFERWMADLLAAGVEEPTAMALATVSADGKPSARMVLLKGADDDGFIFFTNYRSRKAREMESNPNVSLVFYWKELERQVRIEGVVHKVTAAESDAYFHSRPLESRINAVISPQSEAIPDRQHLENLRNEYLNAHSGDPVRPPHWGGYRVVPEIIEFWQGRPGRLHDRIRYTRSKEGWKMARLAP
ncbi:MAG: pyridoxamine 5'-phosphate oxidase [Bacteroidales bacterium]